jgi:hypothetical protein
MSRRCTQIRRLGWFARAPAWCASVWVCWRCFGGDRVARVSLLQLAFRCWVVGCLAALGEIALCAFLSFCLPLADCGCFGGDRAARVSLLLLAVWCVGNLSSLAFGSCGGRLITVNGSAFCCGFFARVLSAALLLLCLFGALLALLWGRSRCARFSPSAWLVLLGWWLLG